MVGQVGVLAATGQPGTPRQSDRLLLAATVIAGTQRDPPDGSGRIPCDTGRAIFSGSSAGQSLGSGEAMRYAVRSSPRRWG